MANKKEVFFDLLERQEAKRGERLIGVYNYGNEKVTLDGDFNVEELFLLAELLTATRYLTEMEKSK